MADGELSTAGADLDVVERGAALAGRTMVGTALSPQTGGHQQQ